MGRFSPEAHRDEGIHHNLYQEDIHTPSTLHMQILTLTHSHKLVFIAGVMMSGCCDWAVDFKGRWCCPSVTFLWSRYFGRNAAIKILQVWLRHSVGINEPIWFLAVRDQRSSSLWPHVCPHDHQRDISGTHRKEFLHPWNYLTIFGWSATISTSLRSTTSSSVWLILIFIFRQSIFLV